MEKDIQKLVEELLHLMEVKAEVSVEKDSDSYKVSVNPEEEAGLLIGGHGSTLSAIESFINIALKQKTGEWVRVSVDIGEWKSKHDQELVELAEQASMRARETGEDQHLYNLTPAQRRVIHMALSEQKGIITESLGEGTGRYLVVRKA